MPPNPNLGRIMKVTVKSKIPNMLRQIKNATKRAVRAACKQIVADVKARVPIDSGALRQSISSKVDAVRGETVVYGVVGPRSKFVKVIKGKPRKPSHYAHLIEKGRFRRPFLAPAWQANSERYLETMQEVLKQEIEKITT